MNIPIQKARDVRIARTDRAKGAGEEGQWFRALADLSEDLSKISSTYKMTHNHL